MNNYDKLIKTQKELVKAQNKFNEAINVYVSDFLPVEDCPDVKRVISNKNLPHYKYYAYTESFGGYLALNIPEFDIKVGIRRCEDDKEFGLGFERIAITKKQ